MYFSALFPPVLSLLSQYNAMQLCQQWTMLWSHQILHQHHLSHLWNAPTALLCTQVMVLKFR